MLIKAQQKHIRLSPRKVRLVADAIRGLSLSEALEYLAHLNKKAALPLLKTLKQAVANATNNLKLKEDDLSIKEIQINEGSTLKRWQPVSRGRAHSILKRTSHIKVILESQDDQSQSPKSQAGMKQSQNKKSKPSSPKKARKAKKPSRSNKLKK
jgi:large subunit ribosomal protein L22